MSFHEHSAARCSLSSLVQSRAGVPQPCRCQTRGLAVSFTIAKAFTRQLLSILWLKVHLLTPQRDEAVPRHVVSGIVWAILAADMRPVRFTMPIREICRNRT